jgi:hypothetical protein
VATSLKGETVQSLNRALAERLYPGRAAARGKDVRALVAARFAVPAARGVPAWDKRGEIEREGYRIEKIEMQPEPQISVPALAFVPQGGEPRKPAVLWVDPAGKAAAEKEIEALALAGNVVLAVDPRGWGESAPREARESGYTKSYQMGMRALLVGRTLAGMQTGDLLRAFDYLAARHDVDSRRITVRGKGNAGVLALFTAALEPRVARVVCQRAPASYMDLVRGRTPEGYFDIVAPGVLRDFDLPDLERALAPRIVERIP